MEEKSRPPSDLSIRFLYQGGQTDIVAVDVATVSQFLPSSTVLPNRDISPLFGCLFVVFPNGF